MMDAEMTQSATPRDSSCDCGCGTAGTLQSMTPCDCNEEHLYIVKGMCSKERLDSLLSAPTAADPTKDKRWTQLFVPEILCIPPQKPNVEQLLSVTSSVQILSQKVIETPFPTTSPLENEEGTLLTGKKLIVEGVLRQQVMYTAAVLEQSVHSAHFDVPFSAFIILAANDPLTRKFKIEACIEDIFVSRVTERKIFKNITLFIKATPIVCP